ncbi:reverse transcriptase domain-containing protein, partial [Tanacetum coccineum]
MTCEDWAAKTSGTITGTLYIDDRTVFVLFDTGATHSIISTTFAKKLNMTPTPLIERVIISTPMKNHMLIESMNMTEELYAKVFESASSRLQQVAFLRHIVSADGSLSDPSKVEAIHQMDDDLLPVTGREFWEIEMEIGSAPYWTLPSVPVVFDIQFDDDRKVWGCVLIAHGKGRWLELLKDYDTNFQYHPGNQINVVADVNLNVQRFGNEYFWWNGILKQDVATRWGSPMWKWDEISMDFVTGLPTTQKRHDAIWVVVDRLTKSAHFLPIRKNYGISKLAEIFRQEIVRLHGTPTSIVSDRDPKFTSRFWKGLQKAWGTRLKFSTAISSPPRWSSERTFNLGRYVEGIWHASIKAAPFELLYGRKCRAPICWDEVGERLIEGPELIEITNEESGCLLRRIERGFQGQAQSSIHWFVEILERIRERFGNRTVASSASLSCGFRSRGSDFDIPVVFSLIIALLRNKLDSQHQMLGFRITRILQGMRTITSSGLCHFVLLDESWHMRQDEDQISPVNDTNPNNMTPESIQAMIDQALLRKSTNRDGSHSSHADNRRNVQTARPCFYANFMKYQPLNFKGTEGVVGLTRWIEKMESVFNISGCAIKNQVKFATCNLLGAALTWWNSQIRTLGEIKKLEIKLWNLKVKGNDVLAYTKCFHELTLICTKFVANETEKVNKYISGLPDNIYGNVKSARPKTLDETIELA